VPSRTEPAGQTALTSALRLARGFLLRAGKLGEGWEVAYRALDSGRYSAVSIDCFDTLLARLAPDWEQHALARIGAALAGQSPVRAGYLTKSARASLRAHGLCEPGALEIWRAFCLLTKLPSTLAEKFAGRELQLLTISSANSNSAREFVTQVSRQHVPLIVCSDTRWPATALGQLLRHHGFDLPEQTLICSCDHNLSKFRGSLYATAAEKIGTLSGNRVPPENILHIGDNLFADYYSAACHGWSCVKVPAARLSAEQRSSAKLARQRLSDIHDELSAML